MKYFPLTQYANLGGNEPGRRFNEWRTELDFNSSKTYRREHVPEYAEIVRAVLTIEGEKGTYIIEFPRKKKEVRIEDGPLTIDVRDWIAIGRHTYRISSLQNSEFSAHLSVAATRPIVATRDGGYVINCENMKYSQRSWLEDDRAAQRIGRFDLYLKTLPQNYCYTEIVSRISLSGKWRYKKVLADDVSDYSSPHTDDSRWDVIDVPHTWEESIPGWEGLVWYRKSVVVPEEWKGKKIILRFSGIDDEPHVYVNAHELGYSCGWHRPFQIDVGDYLDFGRENLVAILVKRRKKEGLGFDGGITYNFIKNWAIVKYPEKKRFLGGIYGEENEIAAANHLGSVIFEPRVHPKHEGIVRIAFYWEKDGKLFPLAMGNSSEFIYKPPYLHYTRLCAGKESGAELRAIVGYDRDLVFLEGQLDGEDGYIVARIDVFPFKFESDVKIGRLQDAVEISAQEDNFRLWFSIPGKMRKADVEIKLDKEHRDYRDYRRNDVVLIRSRPDRAGRFSFVLLSGNRKADDLDWISNLEAPFDFLANQWEEEVYSYTLPERMSENLAASLRTYKQALTLSARLVQGEASGLLTDLIKYPVFWLRDAAISVPGSIYAGKLAFQAAVNTAGEIFGKARKNVEYVILRHDGTMMPGQVNSDSSQLAVYAVYKGWCQMGDGWLREYYDTVKVYVDYMVETDRRFGDALDGIVRASEGDWLDFAYKDKYEREGASLWVNVIYLRALKYGAQMALAVGDQDNAELWGSLYEKGCSLITKKVEDGGLYLEDRGYLAETIQTITSSHPNGWKYPDDLGKVTVYPGFRSMPHCIAIHEEIIRDPGIIRNIVRRIDEYNVVRPFPALVQYPWNDYMKVEGVKGEYEETSFRDRWKCLPGCHAPGGRWAFAGGIVQLGLWDADARELALEAKENQAGYLTLAKQPARPIEDAHFSGLFRNEAGDPKDTEGFYYVWGSATPLEALVEGEYGVRPIPRGVSIDPENCEVGDGIANVVIGGGKISYRRTRERICLVKLDTASDGVLAFSPPFETSLDKTDIRVFDGLAEFRLTDFQLRGRKLLLNYKKEWKKITIRV